MSNNLGCLLLYAPNVHTGGGFVLLQALLAAWPVDQPLVAWLDGRARLSLNVPVGAHVEWVKPSLMSRLKAELSLARRARQKDRVLCFHGLPPWLHLAAPVWVFQQNRNYLGSSPLVNFRWRTRLRLRFEQTLSRRLRHRVARYWVQSPSMAKAVQDWFGSDPPDIHMLPFAPFETPSIQECCGHWDFIYVADGEGHKNHRNLIEAWILLANQGLKPSLALTLPARDNDLKIWISERARTFDLRITDLGHLHHARVLALYRQSHALIFPSQAESFGLPLIEARNADLPILASELDFVRDVCEPVQTFDPCSPVSIARSVRRFMGKTEFPIEPIKAEDFLNVLMRDIV